MMNKDEFGGCHGHVNISRMYTVAGRNDSGHG